MTLRDHIRILVVDDMSTSRGIIMQALESMGIRDIDHADNGMSGMRKARMENPHLVISDLYMPEMNGLQLLQQLRADESTAKIGFILITGRSDNAVITTGQKLGMNNFLTKPFDLAALKECIETVVGPI